MYRCDTDACIWQVPVYRAVRVNLVGNGLTSVLDLGCGNPQKLRAFIWPFIDDIVGVDLPDVIKRFEMPFGRWVEEDLEKGDLNLNRTFDIVMCADVIEHLNRVDKLFDVIKRHSNEETLVVISTPDKRSTVGHPKNKSHVKEYTEDEMRSLLEKAGFIVEKVDHHYEPNATLSYVDNVFVCRKEIKNGK